MLIALLSAAAFAVLILLLILAWAIVQFKIEDRAFELFDELMEESLAAQAELVNRLWGYVRAGHARRKRVEKILRRERNRAAAAELEFHEQVLRMAIRHGEVLDDVDLLKAQNQQLQDNHASLVEDVMTKLLAKEQVNAQVDVLVDRLRRPKR